MNSPNSSEKEEREDEYKPPLEFNTGHSIEHDIYQDHGSSHLSPYSDEGLENANPVSPLQINLKQEQFENNYSNLSSNNEGTPQIKQEVVLTEVKGQQRPDQDSPLKTSRFKSPVNNSPRFSDLRKPEDPKQIGAIIDSIPFFSSMERTPAHTFNGNKDSSKFIPQRTLDSPVRDSMKIQEERISNTTSPARSHAKKKTSPAPSSFKKSTKSPPILPSGSELIIDKSSTDKLKPLQFDRGSTKEKDMDTLRLCPSQNPPGTPQSPV